MAIAAREAELELLTLAYNSSKQITPAQYLGAFRDIIATCDLLIEQYRYSHRVPDTQTFMAVFPSWARGVIRADLAREIGHDNAGSQNVLAITDEMIEAFFKARDVTVVWTLDGLKAATYGTGGVAITNQFFGLATGGAAPQWPGQSGNAAFMLAWLLYPEGTYQFLDGGRLDLGVCATPRSMPPMTMRRLWRCLRALRQRLGGLSGAESRDSEWWQCRDARRGGDLAVLPRVDALFIRGRRGLDLSMPAPDESQSTPRSLDPHGVRVCRVLLLHGCGWLPWLGPRRGLRTVPTSERIFSLESKSL